MRISRRERDANLIILEYKGSRILVRRSSNGLYICPLCSTYQFYNAEDLMKHIVAHAKNLLSKLKPSPKR